jgi:hypothetical protein
VGYSLPTPASWHFTLIPSALIVYVCADDSPQELFRVFLFLKKKKPPGFATDYPFPYFTISKLPRP